jgi:hypothetical protein
VAGELGRLTTTTLSMLSIYLGFALFGWLNWAIVDALCTHDETNDF